jgi:hypothetical protein
VKGAWLLYFSCDSLLELMIRFLPGMQSYDLTHAGLLQVLHLHQASVRRSPHPLAILLQTCVALLHLQVSFLLPDQDCCKKLRKFLSIAVGFLIPTFALCLFTGYEVLVGRNNRQNDVLTNRVATDYDLWFHARNIPGSHVHFSPFTTVN